MRLWRIVASVAIAAARVGAQSESAERIFSSVCARCHGLDGRGGEHGPNISRTLSDADLLRIIRDGKPAAGMPGFASAFSAGQINAIVSWVRVLQGREAGPPAPGDPGHGRDLFFGKARCSQCHMMHGQGGFIGEDLSTWAAGRSADEIRRAITDPNADLDPRSRAVTVVTRDGGTYSGIARNEDNFSLQLQTVDGAFHFFHKADLKKIEWGKGSLMPADYGAVLSRSEMDDLIAYLLRNAGS